MAYRDDVKPWFETGDYPTQEQFYAFFDKVRFLDDVITLVDVTGLVAALAGKANVADLFCEEVTLTSNGNLLMNAKKKLVGISARNNTGSDMTLTFTIKGEAVSLDVPASSNCTIGIGETFWVEDTVAVTGVTGSVTLLIDRK